MKKVIALILTDTHLSKDNIELVESIWDQAISLCKKHDIKNLFFAGDFFTARAAQPLEYISISIGIMDKLKRSGLNFKLISGNHDKTNLNSDKSYLDSCFESDDYRLVRTFDSVEIDSKIFHFLPYFKENGVYPELLATIINGLDKKKENYLITHIAVSGVRNNDNSVVENDLDPNLFKAFKKVYTGHYHDRSKVGDNIYYIGSAYQANFGENEDKGFTLLCDDGSHDLVVSEFPKYVKIKIDINDEKLLKKLEKEHSNSNHNVRFVLEGDESKLAAVNKEKFIEAGIDIKFEKNVVVIDDLNLSNSNTTFDRSNIKDAFDLFCEANKVEEKEVGIKYLEQVL